VGCNSKRPPTQSGRPSSRVRFRVQCAFGNARFLAAPRSNKKAFYKVMQKMCKTCVKKALKVSTFVRTMRCPNKCPNPFFTQGFTQLFALPRLRAGIFLQITTQFLFCQKSRAKILVGEGYNHYSFFGYFFVSF